MLPKLSHNYKSTSPSTIALSYGLAMLGRKPKMIRATTYRDTCNLFDQLTERIHDEMYTITNIQRLIVEANKLAEEKLNHNETQEYESSVSEVLSDENKLGLPSEILDSLLKDLEKGTYRQRITEVTARNLNKAEQFNASATLIYAHSHFEICLDNIISISTYSHKDEWLDEISNQTIKVGDLRMRNLQEILDGKIEKKIEKIEKESVKFKLALLFRLFKPESNQEQPKDYKYELTKVEEIDDLRHKVVHESPLVYDRVRLKTDVHYLTMTLLYLVMILQSNFKLIRIPKEYNHLFDEDGKEIDAEKIQKTKGNNIEEPKVSQ